MLLQLMRVYDKMDRRRLKYVVFLISVRKKLSMDTDADICTENLRVSLLCPVSFLVSQKECFVIGCPRLCSAGQGSNQYSWKGQNLQSRPMFRLGLFSQNE